MIALVDCNNFFVSCERLFEPGLRKKPVVVLSNNDGCIISRSQEAKDLGLKMGEPLFKAQPLIERENVRVFSSNFMLYGDMSNRVMQVLATFAPVEQYSVDEAFLDLTHIAPAKLPETGLQIRATILQYLGLPVCVGIAPTKTLAKVANHLAKKNKDLAGVHVLDTTQKQTTALQTTPIADIWGVGRQYAAKLQALQVYTAADLLNRSSSWIQKNLGGVVGLRLVSELSGTPCQEVEDIQASKKSISCTRSFSHYIGQLDELGETVSTYVARAAEKLRRQQSAVNLITVFIRTNKFSAQAPQHHVSTTMVLPVASADTGELTLMALAGLKKLYQPGFLYKKAGVILSGLVPYNQVQADIFDVVNRPKSKALMETLDKLNSKMSKNEWATTMVGYASAGGLYKDKKIHKAWRMNLGMRSPRYTTHWQELLVIKI